MIGGGGGGGGGAPQHYEASRGPYYIAEGSFLHSGGVLITKGIPLKHFEAL